MSEWNRKELWIRRALTFAVEISRHEVYDPENEGKHRWAVYAYVRNDHPHFPEFEGDDMWQPAARVMPFHWGCTNIDITRDEKGEPICYRAGADYAHLHDDWFTRQEMMPAEVQKDADELYEWMLLREGAES